jgi:hypothetical protein
MDFGIRNLLIIFSKNRACQLHLLLESLTINGAGLFFDKVKILYKSDDEYSLGYNKLKKIFAGVEFVEETNFRNNLLSMMDDKYTTTTFMVDDCILYKPLMARKEYITNWLTNDTVCFSLRLGKNCEYSHPANLSYKLGEHTHDGEFIKFDYTKQENGDFKYPLSVDGHIFKTDFIKGLLVEIMFSNPNTLEANLQQFVMLGKIPMNVVSYNESKLVGVPVNMVNSVFNNRHGLQYYVSEKELNDRYINGERIDLSKLDLANINGPHKEIKYEFKNES